MSSQGKARLGRIVVWEGDEGKLEGWKDREGCGVGGFLEGKLEGWKGF